MHLLTFEKRREHLIGHLCQHLVSLLVHLRFVVVNFPVRINYKHFRKRHSYIHVTNCVCVSISKATIERCLITWKELNYVFETGNFEHLRFPENDFSAEGVHQAVRTH